MEYYWKKSILNTLLDPKAQRIKVLANKISSILTSVSHGGFMFNLTVDLFILKLPHNRMYN